MIILLTQRKVICKKSCYILKVSPWVGHILMLDMIKFKSIHRTILSTYSPASLFLLILINLILWELRIGNETMNRLIKKYS